MQYKINCVKTFNKYFGNPFLWDFKTILLLIIISVLQMKKPSQNDVKWFAHITSPRVRIQYLMLISISYVYLILNPILVIWFAHITSPRVRIQYLMLISISYVYLILNPIFFPLYLMIELLKWCKMAGWMTGYYNLDMSAQMHWLGL